MSLRLYDTATRTVRDFHPLRSGTVSIYLCGATVQGVPHIGHIRSGLNFDVLRRWLARQGNDVLFVRNVTDIDDKILVKAAEAGRPWWEWAATHERAFLAAYDALGCLPASIEPRATGHITQMVELMQRLMDRGHAYAADGDVYFSVASFPEYGALSGQRLDEVQQGESLATGKRDPRDFTLWKGAKPGEPSWPTPWGRGRPGWHLECSAMATTYLGAEFDIHGGGQDLVFPHHENEQAQSHAAGLGFARYWMHNAWVTISGEKMSKSLGNSLVVTELTRTVRPLVLRYYLGSAHYRSTVEYGPGSMDEAAAAVDRIESFLHRAVEVGGVDRERLLQEAATAPLPERFAEAMDDDVNVPEALAVVFTAVRDGNRALDAGEPVQETAVRVAAMTDVLGVNPLAPQWAQPGDTGRAHEVLEALVRERLDAREAARRARDFATADAIRDQLTAVGITIEDTPAGARWSLS